MLYRRVNSTVCQDTTMKKSSRNGQKHMGGLMSALSLSLCIFLCACGSGINTEPVTAVATETPEPTGSPIPAPTASPTPTPSPSPEPTEEPFQEYDITLMAVGDNLMHMGIVYTGKQEDGSFDYSFLFENISEFLDNADIKVINQETILGGNELGFSGFPYFNSPTQVGDAIASAGFNVVLHASNHAADQNLSGLESCVDFWAQYPEVLMVGITGEEPAEQIPVLEVEGVTFAVLNYTYGPNMATLPKSLMGHLNMLCDYNPKTGAIDFTTLNPPSVVLKITPRCDRSAAGR